MQTSNFRLNIQFSSIDVVTSITFDDFPGTFGIHTRCSVGNATKKYKGQSTTNNWKCDCKQKHWRTTHGWCHTARRSRWENISYWGFRLEKEDNDEIIYFGQTEIIHFVDSGVSFMHKEQSFWFQSIWCSERMSSDDQRYQTRSTGGLMVLFHMWSIVHLKDYLMLFGQSKQLLLNGRKKHVSDLWRKATRRSSWRSSGMNRMILIALCI